MPRLAAILASTACLTSTLLGQSEIVGFRPNALAAGYGGSLVVQARDPSAVFWNPALLAGLKHRELLIGVHKPFGFNFVAATQYIPLIGTIGASFSRIGEASANLDRGTLSWGHKIVRGFTAGASVDLNRRRGTLTSTAGFGLFVGHPATGSLYHRPSQNAPELLDRMNLGITVHGLPLSERLVDPTVFFGFSYLLTDDGVLLNTGYHVKETGNSIHAGLGWRLSSNIFLLAGTEDFEPGKLNLGVGYRQHNFILNAVYSIERERFMFTLSARISATAVDLANPHYLRGTEYFHSGDFQSATKELKKYLSYDIDEARTDTAQYLVRRLELKLARQRIRVDSLFADAQRYLAQKKPQTLRAAFLLSKILELEPKNLKARIKLASLKPKVQRWINRSIADGVYEFDSGNYERSKQFFARILLLDNENKYALSYLARIDQFYADLSQQYFFRGVGFLENKEYDSAVEQFNLALHHSPDMTEARRYLNLTVERAAERRRQIDALLRSARLSEQAGNYLEAKGKYEQVGNLEAGNETARIGLAAVNAKIEAEQREAEKKKQQAITYFSRADQAFRNQDWQKAFELASDGLRLDPTNSRANEQKTVARDKLEATNLLGAGRIELIEENYLEALIHFERGLALDSTNQELTSQLNMTKARIGELVEKYFDEGINLYTLDKYQEAIAKWNAALLLDPEHKGSRDYRAQAEERIKALKAIKQ